MRDEAGACIAASGDIGYGARYFGAGLRGRIERFREGRLYGGVAKTVTRCDEAAAKLGEGARLRKFPSTNYHMRKWIAESAMWRRGDFDLLLAAIFGVTRYGWR